MPCSPLIWQSILKFCKDLGEEIPYFLHKIRRQKQNCSTKSYGAVLDTANSVSIAPPEAPPWSLRSWPVHFGTGISFHRDFPFLWCRLQGTNLICPYISCYIYFSSKLKYVSVKCKFDNKLAYITFYCWVGHTKWSTTTLEASLCRPLSTNLNVLPHKPFLLPNSVNFEVEEGIQSILKCKEAHGIRVQ